MAYFLGVGFSAYKNEKKLCTTSACILFVLVVVLLPQIGFSSTTQNLSGKNALNNKDMAKQ